MKHLHTNCSSWFAGRTHPIHMQGRTCWRSANNRTAPGKTWEQSKIQDHAHTLHPIRIKFSKFTNLWETHHHRNWNGSKDSRIVFHSLGNRIPFQTLLHIALKEHMEITYLLALRKHYINKTRQKASDRNIINQMLIKNPSKQSLPLL